MPGRKFWYYANNGKYEVLVLANQDTAYKCEVLTGPYKGDVIYVWVDEVKDSDWIPV